MKAQQLKDAATLAMEYGEQVRAVKDIGDRYAAAIRAANVIRDTELFPAQARMIEVRRQLDEAMAPTSAALPAVCA